MKENVLDVLMYLFENYMDHEEEGEEEGANQPDNAALSIELQQAGFHESDINKAISWLEGLSDLQDSELNDVIQNTKSFRVFSEQEKRKLNRDCMGFILFMDHIGAFNQNLREIIIDRVMALEAPEIDLEQLKWVMLLVLFNQPGNEAAFEWIEDVVFDEISSSIH